MTEAYFIDAENAAEMARLVNQDRITTRCMGGLFPPQLDLSNVHTILDIACGPGGWVIDVAQAYPDKQVTGIDVSQLMIAYAGELAKLHEVHNARFNVANILQPLPFSDHSFDVINARLVSGFMPQTMWRQFLQECLRITRPGGIMRLIEPERTISNSPAVEQLNDFLARAMHKAGQSLSPNETAIWRYAPLKTLLARRGLPEHPAGLACA